MMMKKLLNAELSRVDTNTFRQKDKSPFLLILDNVRSMNNVGSLFRTADAFAAECVCLCGITATPPHRDIEKTALGATDSVSWKHYPNAAEAALEWASKGWEIWAVEQLDTSIDLSIFTPKADKKYALIFGNEVSGVSEEVLGLCQGGIEIPQFGTKHSFNIAVSAGIVLWDLHTKMNAASK